MARTTNTDGERRRYTKSKRERQTERERDKERDWERERVKLIWGTDWQTDGQLVLGTTKNTLRLYTDKMQLSGKRSVLVARE